MRYWNSTNILHRACENEGYLVFENVNTKVEQTWQIMKEPL